MTTLCKYKSVLVKKEVFMVAIICYCAALVCLLTTRVIARYWPVGYLLGGLIFGIYNEIIFEFCWNYSPKLGPMVWRDVPLIIILGWSLYTALGLSLSDRLTKKLQIRSLALRKLFDILLFCGIGYPLELLMPSLHLWTYTYAMQAYPAIQIIGYVFVGTLITATGRQIQSYFK